MSIELKVFDNGDHTCLVWLPSAPQTMANCRGFTILRKGKGPDCYIPGAVGFSDTDKLDPSAPWKFPLQRYMWWDYGVQVGDTVQYSVIPVTGTDRNHLTLDSANASPLTAEMTITGQCTPHMSAYFNRGIVATQYVSKALGGTPKAASIKALVATKGNAVRNAMSGMLRPQILTLLGDTLKAKGKIYAALYELNDQELIDALVALGKNCNLILGNGAFKSNTPPNNDENAAVRAKIKSKVNLSDRIVSLGHFAHNKFVVFCDSAGKAQKVLTGSTNWTSSGLCTQANNGLIIEDAAVAGDYLDAWNRLKAAGNAYTPALVKGNSASTTYEVDGASVTPWFVRTSAAQDLDFARKLINGAQEGILFLFFNPGAFEQDPTKWTLLQNILERQNSNETALYNPNLYFRGVVNQEIAQLTEPANPAQGKGPAPALDPTAPSPVTLFGSGPQTATKLGSEVMVPRAIKTKFDTWNAELLGASMVNIHSKVIVLDPFGEHPVVMTGSHNLGFKASSANDDNLCIIENNAPLAAAYAINIIAIYQNYRWNSYVEAHRNDPKVWHGLVDSDDWQASHLQGDQLNEIKFWLSEKVPAVAPAVTAAPRGSTAAAPAAAVHRVRAVTTKAPKPTATKTIRKVAKKAAAAHA